MTLLVVNGPFIAAGESLSDVIDCTAGTVARITMPGNWSSAVLTFQVSSDGQLYNDLFLSDGREVAFEVVPGSAVLVPKDIASALAFMKFRSGTRDNPITQRELREFAVALDVIGPP